MNKITFIIILSILLVSCANEQRKSKDEFFVFEPDIRLLTSYAFMNAAGYGHDWNATMHPVRTEVREYLDSILTDDYKNEIRQYYEKFGGGDFYGSETSTNYKDEMYDKFEGESCNFIFEENEFFGRVATRDLFLYNT